MPGIDGDARHEQENQAALLEELRELGQHPERWREADPETLRMLAYMELLSYGLTNDAGQVPRLMRLYQQVVAGSSEEERRELEQRVVEEAATGRVSGNSLMPFIFAEPSVGIISTASLDLAMVTPREDDDVLSGPRFLRKMAEEMTSDQDIRTGILMGLLMLGDRRTLPLLDRCWLILDEPHRLQLAQAWSGFLYASVIEFFLGWLDDCIATGDDGVFGAVAAAVAKVPMSSRIMGGIQDVERTYPAWLAASESPIKHLAVWTVEEYARLIEPRLRDLAQREGEPRVMPMVMEQWGLTYP